MRCDPGGWRLYFIPEAGLRLSPAEQAARALAGGAEVLQLRLKGAPDEEWTRVGRELRELCRALGRPFVVNDRPEMAELLEADGLHLGREDVPLAAARKRLGAGVIIGMSVTGVDEARRAGDEGADYLAVGPVFPSSLKPGVAPLGTVAVSRIREAVDLPLIAIGGIHAGNAAAVMEAGADGVAVISAISRAEDPEAAASGLLAELRRKPIRGRGRT